MVKRLSTMWETGVRALGWEYPLEKEMAIHSSTIAWKIPWTEEPGRLQSMGSQRVGRNWAISLHFTSLHPFVGKWRGKVAAAGGSGGGPVTWESWSDFVLVSWSCQSLNHPDGLSYSPGQEPSWVSLGWNLGLAGGCVSPTGSSGGECVFLTLQPPLAREPLCVPGGPQPGEQLHLEASWFDWAPLEHPG